MPDTPELPEAKDPFEKRVAISIAVIAVLLSYVSMRGDNGKTDSIVNTTKESDQWEFFQAKSLKQHLAEMEADLLASLPGAGATAKKREELAAKAKEYEAEKAAIKQEAENYGAEARKGAEMNDRCDAAGLFLQIAIVVASVAILSRQRLLWYAGLALGVFGAAKFFLL